MKHFFKIFWLGLLLIFMAGCGIGGPDGSRNSLTPTPPVPVFGDFVLNFSVTRGGVETSSNSPSKEMVAALDGLNIEEARVSVSDVSFFMLGEDLSMLESQFPGTTVVRPITNGEVVNEAFPPIPLTVIEYGEYGGFVFNLKQLDEGEISQALLGDPLVESLLVQESLVVEGSFQEEEGQDVDGDGQVSWVPYSVVSGQQGGLDVAFADSLEVSDDKVNYFFIAFNVTVWFDDLLPEFRALGPGDLTDGVLVLDGQSSDQTLNDLLGIFEENVQGSVFSAPSEDASFDPSDVDLSSRSQGIPFFVPAPGPSATASPSPSAPPFQQP